MAKHQQLSGELFFGNNIRTNINTTHSDTQTHKFTLEIIISQAAGRPISLEYSKYQAINGNYCFDNIQCSCMHIFLSFFTDLFSSSFCSHIQKHAFWFLLLWTCNHFIEDAMQWVRIDFYFGFSLVMLKLHLVPLCKRKATKAHYITFKTEKSFNCCHLCVKSTKYTDNQIYGSFSMNQNENISQQNPVQLLNWQ